MDAIKALLETPRYAAASAAFDEIADAHGVDYSLTVSEDGSLGTACKCGRPFRTTRARGLHIAATNRAALRAFDAALRAFDAAAA